MGEFYTIGGKKYSWTKSGKRFNLILMTETKGNQTFNSEFHRRYVGGEGEVVERPVGVVSTQEIGGHTYQEVLDEYRWYMRDPEAELPKKIIETLKATGRV